MAKQKRDLKKEATSAAVGKKKSKKTDAAAADNKMNAAKLQQMKSIDEQPLKPTMNGSEKAAAAAGKTKNKGKKEGGGPGAVTKQPTTDMNDVKIQVK